MSSSRRRCSNYVLFLFVVQGENLWPMDYVIIRVFSDETRTDRNVHPHGQHDHNQKLLLPKMRMGEADG
jgi:hypothetical protein